MNTTTQEQRVLDLIAEKCRRDLEQVGDSDKRAPIQFHYNRIRDEFLRVVSQYHRWLDTSEFEPPSDISGFETFYKEWIPRGTE